jgi:hypothetical protein
LLKFKFKTRTFDPQAYLARVDQNLAALHSRVARHFLAAAFQATPVRSGAAASTFLKLAAAVNFPAPLIVATETPPKNARKYRRDHSIATGTQKSKGASSRLNLKDDIAYSFSYAHAILHWQQSPTGFPDHVPWNILFRIRQSVVKTALESVNVKQLLAGGPLQHTVPREYNF